MINKLIEGFVNVINWHSTIYTIFSVYHIHSNFRLQWDSIVIAIATYPRISMTIIIIKSTFM